MVNQYVKQKISHLSSILFLAMAANLSAVSVVGNLSLRVPNAPRLAPANEPLITEAGSPVYVTCSSGQESDGADCSRGLSGHVTSPNLIDTDLPDGYLIHSQFFNLSASLTGTFDFKRVPDGTFDDIAFIVGDRQMARRIHPLENFQV